MLRYTVLEDGLLSGYLVEGFLATVLIQLLVAVKGVSAVAHHLARRRHVAQLLCQLKPIFTIAMGQSNCSAAFPCLVGGLTLLV